MNEKVDSGEHNTRSQGVLFHLKIYVVGYIPRKYGDFLRILIRKGLSYITGIKRNVKSCQLIRSKE